MSLFQYGFHQSSRLVATVETGESQNAPPHMPSIEESGLGRVEYDSITASTSELADPTPTTKKRKTRVKYTVYKGEHRAQIGKYALENGNEKARLHFLSTFPNLKESTIRNFKKAYREIIEHERKQQHPKLVTVIPALPRGRPPILQELDEKLLKFLRAVRCKGGVVNRHVVRAATTALIASNPSTSQHLAKFAMPRSWVQSIYHRMVLLRDLQYHQDCTRNAEWST